MSFSGSFYIFKNNILNYFLCEYNLINSSQGDITNFKQALFVDEKRPEKISPEKDPFINW